MHLVVFEPYDKECEWHEDVASLELLFKDMRVSLGGEEIESSIAATLLLSDGREYKGVVCVNKFPTDAVRSRFEHNARRAGRARCSVILGMDYWNWTWRDYCENTAGMTINEIIEMLKPELLSSKDASDNPKVRPISKRTFEARLSSAKKRAESENCDDVMLEDMLNS